MCVWFINDAASISDYTDSNHKDVNEKGIAKEVEESAVASYKVISRHLPRGLMRTTKNISQNRASGPRLNPRPPDNEAGQLTTRQLHYHVQTI